MIEALERLLENHARGRISRREAALGILALATTAVGTAPTGASTPPDSTFRTLGLNHLGLRVTDVARSRDFYLQHLGMSVIRDNSPGPCFLKAGEHYMGLFGSREPGIDHFCFTVEGYEADRTMAKLEDSGFSPRRQENRVYFDDPDGLEVQLDSRYGSWPGPPPDEASDG